MCGRFTLHSPLDVVLARFDLDQLDFDYTPSYNVAPTQPVVTIISSGAEFKAALLQWGLIPSWQRKPSKPLINARLETLSERKTFQRLVDSRRCLIAADGFYEWATGNSGKYPVYITLKQGGPFAFAGLWDDSTPPSCTIVTQNSNSYLRPIHHRMPVILTRRQERLWLGAAPFSEVRNALTESETLPLKYHRVSTLVNSPKNNEPACILRIAESHHQ